MSFCVKLSAFTPDSRAHQQILSKMKERVTRVLEAVEMDMLEFKDCSSKVHAVIIVKGIDRNQACSLKKRITLISEDHEWKIEMLQITQLQMNIQEQESLTAICKNQLQSKKAYLSGIPHDMKSGEMLKLLECFGSIKSSYICKKNKKGNYLFGFVIYEKYQSFIDAICERKILYNNHWIRIKPPGDFNSNEKKLIATKIDKKVEDAKIQTKEMFWSINEVSLSIAQKSRILLQVENNHSHQNIHISRSRTKVKAPVFLMLYSGFYF